MLFGMDCLFILSTFTLIFLIGLPFLYLVPSSAFNNKYLISPIFGYGVAGFLATVLYKAGLSHLHLYEILCFIAICILSTLIYKRRTIFNKFSIHSRQNIIILTMWVSALILILIPYWLGGTQFSVYQGWIWDQFSYLGAALTFHHKSYAQVMASTGDSFLHAPVSLFGAIEISRRPTIEFLYSLLTQPVPHEMYRYGYLYLAMFVSNSILAATFLITNIFNCSIYRALIVAIAIFVGFWGQSYIDFNAWAMTGAMPILLLVVTYVIIAARNIQSQTPLKLINLIPLSCLIAFALYIYPEDSIFHLPGLLAILLMVNFIGWKFQNKKNMLVPTSKVFLAILIGLSLSALFFTATIGYFLWAAGFSAQNIMTQAVYGDYLQPIFGQANWFRPLLFAAVNFSTTTVNVENQGVVLLYILKKIFIEGHPELIYYGIVDGFYGFFGMYFLTPLASLAQSTQEIWRGVLAIGLVGFLWFNFKSYVEAVSKYRSYFLFVGLMAGMLLFFLLMTRVYAMARGLYFLAPYALILFFIPFLLSKKIFTLKNSFYLLVILSQFTFGVVRIDLAKSHHNPIYPLPYTLARTHYFLEGKSDYDWNLSKFDKALKQCHRIYVDVPNGWQQYGVNFYLYSKNKQYVQKGPVKTSFWATTPVGYQALNGKEDCAISIVKKELPNNVVFNELTIGPYVSKKSIS